MADSQVRQRLAAVLAADVAGYSRLMGDDERATIATLDEYRAVFRSYIEANNGRVVDMAGDSILAIFDTASGAVRAAIDAQTELGKRNEALPEGSRMEFRVGINSGDIQEKSDGTIYGDGVNVAARLEALASPGGVNVSGSVFDSVRSKLGLPFDFLGEHEVKNIADPVRAYRVLDSGNVDDRSPSKAKWVKRAVVGVTVIGAIVGAFFLQLMRTEKSETASHAISENEQAENAELVMPTGPAIAVLPFESLSGDEEDDYFATGLTEDLIVGLSRFTYFFVIARNSTLIYKGRSVDVREVARDLGAQYVVEGSVRRTGQALRVSVRLLDGDAGTDLWSETYDRDLSAASLFEVQDEITDNIAGTIGDNSGIVARARHSASRDKPPNNLSAYECWLRMSAYYDAPTPERHLEIRACAERTVEVEPDYPQGWVTLAYMALDEYRFGFNPRPNSIETAINAYRTAIKMNPTHQDARHGLAEALFAAGNVDAALVESERAIALNPNNSTTLAALGNKMLYAGHVDRGMGLTRKAIALNPNHPTWYYYTITGFHYFNREYEEALTSTLKIEWKNLHWTHMWLAAIYGQLGRVDEAQAALRDLLDLYPDYGENAWREFDTFNLPIANREQIAEGLAKAGLVIRITAPPATN